MEIEKINETKITKYSVKFKKERFIIEEIDNGKTIKFKTYICDSSKLNVKVTRAFIKEWEKGKLDKLKIEE